MSGRVLAVLVAVLAVLIGATVAEASPGEEQVVKAKTVRIDGKKVRVALVTKGSRVYVRLSRKGKVVDRARIKKLKAGGELNQFLIEKFETATQLTVRWMNAGESEDHTAYITLTSKEATVNSVS